MKRSEIIPESELADKILKIIHTLEANKPEYIDLGNWAFDQLPCSRNRFYRVVRNHCHKWGYEYHGISYRRSTAGYKEPFDRVPEERKARVLKPSLTRIKTKESL